MSAQPVATRDLGLDAVRAASIGLVMLSHSVLFFHYSFSTGLFVQYGGWLGVEIFFSLSGFLIGRIMLSMERGPLDRRALLTFFVRRWLRTLPLYYLVLLVMMADGFALSRVDFLLINGFVPPVRWGLATAWSLGVEEFFYLAFPLLMAGLVWAGVVRGRSAVAMTALLMMAAGWLFRVSFYFSGDLTVTDLLYFRINPLLRIDACAFGVLLACVLRNRGGVAAWRPSLRLRLGLLGSFLVAAAVAGEMLLVVNLAALHPHPSTALRALSGIDHVVLWTALDLAALLAILGLLGVAQGRWRILGGVIRFGSRISYGLYLIHVPVIARVMELGHDLPPALAAALAYGLSLLLAALAYRLFEAPILAWRDRLLPVGGAAARAVPAAVAGTVQGMPT